MNKKFIFVKEELSLIIEIEANIDKIRDFYMGIVQRLLDGSKSFEQPICITAKVNESVCFFLQNNYSEIKTVNKLINFFERMNNGDYLYFYPYNSDVDDLYDILKESLAYYNQKLSDAEIAEKMRVYLDEFNNAKKILDKFPYNVKPMIPNKIVKIGESDKKKRKCIYCEGNMEHGDASYREKAHAIPEAVGNTKFFQNEECDSCNDFFAQNAEEDLSNMLMFNRLQYGIKGKEGYPTFQLTNNRYVKYFDWETEDYQKNWKYFESIKKIVKKQKVKGPAVIDIGGNINVGEYVAIEALKDYIPMHVYKTLVKSLIGLIGNENLVDFKDTIHWLRYEEEYVKLPEVAMLKASKIYKEPELYIFVRKDECDYTLPYCYGEIRIIDQIFIFIVPFCSKDQRQFCNIKYEQAFLDILNKIYGNYALIDLSSIKVKKIEESFIKVKELQIE